MFEHNHLGLGELIGLVRSVLFFDAQTFTVAANGVGVWLALSILLAAGISDGIGKHSVVLITHGLSRRVFAVHVLLRGMVFVLGALFWIAAVWGVSRAVFGEARPLVQVLRLSSVGYLPLLLSFVMLAPYLGPSLRSLLGAWSLVIMLLLVAHLFDLALWQASVSTLGTAGVVHAFRRALRPCLDQLDRWMWRVTTGTPTRVDLAGIPQAVPVSPLI